MPDINDDRLINAIAKATADDSEPESPPYTGMQMARGEHLVKPVGETSIMEDMLNIKNLSNEILGGDNAKGE